MISARSWQAGSPFLVPVEPESHAEPFQFVSAGRTAASREVEVYIAVSLWLVALYKPAFHERTAFVAASRARFRAAFFPDRP